MKHQKLIENVINSTAWANDNAGKLINRMIRILISCGLSEGEAYEYLELQ